MSRQRDILLLYITQTLSAFKWEKYIKVLLMVSIDLFVLVKHPAVVFNLIIYIYIYILLHNENKWM